jgi:hypothetical protein
VVGFNEDEAHRIVFDGAIPTVASGRTFLNYRFSQVGRINPAGHGFMFFPGGEFPFAYENQTDPFTGKSDGILARCTASNTCPSTSTAERNTGRQANRSSPPTRSASAILRRPATCAFGQ